MEKNKKQPLVSVVVVAHNSRRTIKRCLESIKDQTYKNTETVVVDSLFYDPKEQKKCKNIIIKFAKYLQDGPERSIQRNRGIHEAKGQYLLLLDQDMYLTPTVIEECYKTLSRNKYVALTIPELSIGEGFWTKCVALERYVSTYLENGMNECCRFFRKKDALSIGGYDPGIVGVEDSDFHYRMAGIGSIGKIKSVINHDEGHIRFFNRVKKKYYYSRAFRKYIIRYPSIAVAQFFPIKKAYVKHWKLFVKDPTVALGIILLRSAEVTAGFLGLILKNKT